MIDDLSRDVLHEIKKMGRIEEIIRELIRHEIFDDLSKHNTFWHHEDDETQDKLSKTRGQLINIYDELVRMLEIIDG